MYVHTYRAQLYSIHSNSSKAPRFNTAILVLTYLILSLLLGILAMAYPTIRAKLHDQFEWTHRFAGWTALALVWAHLIIVVASQTPLDQSLSPQLARTPALYLLALTTLSIASPWLRLRRVRVIPETLSTHAIRLHFPGISNNLVNATYTDTPALVWQPRCLSLQSHPTPPLTVSRATTISLYLVLISFLVLVLQAVGFILSLLGPLVTGAINIVLIVVHIALVTIFQAGAGAEVPWFLSTGCAHAFYPKNVAFCQQAQGAFAVSIMLIAMYVGMFAWAVLSVLSSEKRAEETGGGWKQDVEPGAEMDPYLQR